MRRRTVLSIVIAACAAFLTAASPAPAKVVYVDADATGANNGSSWANAYYYLQDALMFAVAGDEIRVAQGVYRPDDFVLSDRPSLGRAETFQLINGVTLKGGYAGYGEPDPNAWDIELYETILSGDLDGNDVNVRWPNDLLGHPSRADNSYHVVTGSGTDANTILGGFTITGGNANAFQGYGLGGGVYNASGSPTVADCVFNGNSSLYSGGAMYNAFQSNLTLTRCTFRGNAAVEGGGMYNRANATLVKCTFLGNWAEACGGAFYNTGSARTSVEDCEVNGNSSGTGGGIYNDAGSMSIDRCTISDNSARNAGGGIKGWNYTVTHSVITGNSCDIESGGGMSGCERVANCTISGNSAGADGGGMNDCEEVIDCIISENSATNYGGGIFLSGEATITGCVFTENTAEYGGALAMSLSTSGPVVLRDCSLVANSAVYGGGVASLAIHEGCLPQFHSCRFVSNSAGQEGGGLYIGRNTIPLFTGCIIAGNTAGVFGGGIHWGGSDITTSAIGCTFSGNSAASGGAIYALQSDLALKECILRGSRPEEIHNENGSVVIRYSDLEGGWPGPGNIDADPCFPDPGYWDANGTHGDANDDFWVNGDYHLKSQAGRWDSNSGTWFIDDVTSPCIDAGDPMSPVGHEPFPNGGIVNMGAYGGTTEASKSYFGKPPCKTIVAGDINGDCEIDFRDFCMMALHWCEDHNLSTF